MAFFSELKQGPPSNELHGEVGLWAASVVGGPRLVDLSNTGMLQSAECVGFPREATQQFAIYESRLDDFESNDSVRMFLLGQKNRPHAAFSQQSKNAIVANHYGRARRGRGVAFGRAVACCRC